MFGFKKKASPDHTHEKIFAYKSNYQYFNEKFRHWPRRIIITFITFYLIFNFAKLFVYIDTNNNCFIRLEPAFTEFNNGSIVEGIKLIKKISPTDYKNLCENVTVISPNIGCGGVHGGCYYLNQPKKIYVNASNRDLVWNAEVLVHETCHSMQASENRELSEDECYKENARIRKIIIEY